MAGNCADSNLSGPLQSRTSSRSLSGYRHRLTDSYIACVDTHLDRRRGADGHRRHRLCCRRYFYMHHRPPAVGTLSACCSTTVFSFFSRTYYVIKSVAARNKRLVGRMRARVPLFLFFSLSRARVITDYSSFIN
jgi:hypothetical protein